MAKIDEVRSTLFVVMRSERQALRTYEETRRQADALANQLALLEEQEAQKIAVAEALARAKPGPTMPPGSSGESNVGGKPVGVSEEPA